MVKDDIQPKLKLATAKTYSKRYQWRIMSAFKPIESMMKRTKLVQTPTVADDLSLLARENKRTEVLCFSVGFTLQ
jgi:hypothetical protein